MQHIYISKKNVNMENSCYYQEKDLVCWSSEISSAGKEATLNTLIIAARLQTQPSWACVGAVMDTSDHYMRGRILQRVIFSKSY